MSHEDDSNSTTAPSTFHTASAGFGLLDDVPPSYDSVTGTTSGVDLPSPPLTQGDCNQGEGSSSRPEPSHRGNPANMNALFAGPPNAEVLISRDRAEAGSPNPPIELHKAVFGKTETWDPRLSDPEALYNFLHAQALRPPHIKIRCYAQHTETAQVQTTVMEDNRLVTRQPGQTYNVTDFDFTIDLTPVYAHADNTNNLHLMARRPQVPAHRGTHQMTFGASVAPNACPGHRTVGRTATAAETDMWEEWSKFCKLRGRAPWASMEYDEEFLVALSARSRSGIHLGRLMGSREGRAPDEESLLQSSGGADGHETTLKQWCEAYCADPGLLKSFVFHKIIWGWDFHNLRAAIERAILSTGYQQSGKGIQIIISASEDDMVTVRPNNWLVRATGSMFWLIILWITLLYPIIWIWQRLSPRGGAPYDVAVATYAMKFYPPLPGTFPNETVEQARDRLPRMFKLHREVPRNPFLHRGPKGVHYLLGRREGEWFRGWEDVIRMGVRMRYQGELIQTVIDDDDEGPELDGY